MTAIDIAERKSKLRAILFYMLAAALLLLLIATVSGGVDFLNGLWAGLLLGAALNFTPLGRWLKPNSAVARLLDDESSRENRRVAMSAGFWAATLCSFIMANVAQFSSGVSAYDAVRVVGTATMVAALVAFATLELRAAR